MEEWKDIIGYEGKYQVSNTGKIRSLNYRRTGKIKLLKPTTDRDGYKTILLYKNNKQKRYKLHRLIAKVFINNPNDLPEVNHKDEDKSNNRVENLEWCDRKYNANYGTIKERIAETNFKKVRCIDTGEIFNSINEAAEKYNIHNSTLVHYLKGRGNSVAGYKWEYYKEG